MATIVEQLEAARLLGFDYILFEDNEPHSLYHTGEEAMDKLVDLDQEGAEHGTLEVVFVNTGDVYATNGLPDDIEED